ncbi:MAG: VWA domain-containing protein [Verrucomicrobiota bacterium]
MIQFGNPTALWWLVLVPVLALFLVWAYRARRRSLARFVAQPLADRLTQSVRLVARRWKAVLLVAGILFVVVALAQPRWGYEWRQVKRKGVDVFVLLDVSKSMLTEDVRPNRLAQAKFAVEDLLAKLQGDRIGLIAFAGTAFVQCPLTVDYDAFRLALREADPRVIPRGGTAIAAALRTALKAFEAGEGRDRAVVIITDGEATEGDALAAAEEAATAGARIYAIGVGSVEGELIPVREDGKGMEFLKDREGKVVKSRLDEETLQQLAVKTQGIYVRSAAGDFGMETVYEKGIGQLQRQAHEERLQKRYFERFQWPLGIGVVLLVIEMFVSDRKRVVVLALLLLAGVSQAAENWPVTYNHGVTAYRSNDFTAAVATFEQATASTDRPLQAKALYNLGNARYRLGQAAEPQSLDQAIPIFKKSLRAYETALAANPQDADAKFNRDLVKKKIVELEKQQEQQRQQQSQQNRQDQQKQKNEQQQPTGKDDKQQQPPSEPEQQQTKKGSEQGKQQPPQEAKPSAGQENFDKQRAAAMLDNLREDERNWNFFPEMQMQDLKDKGETAKDW